MAAVISSLRTRRSKDGKRTAVCIRISSDAEREYILSEGTYREIGCPLSGEMLNEDALILITERDAQIRARTAALRILSYADNNKATLLRKLLIKGIDRPLAEGTVREMVARGYINEGEQLSRLIVKYACSELIGRYRIEARLLSKGYSLSDIRAVLAALEESGEVDFDSSREKLIEKKLPAEHGPEDVKKLLYKYGYRK